MKPGDLPDAVAALLLDYELTEAERASVNPFWLLDLEFPDRQHPCPTWTAHRSVLLPYFVRRHPGRRPSRWWLYDAPRQPLGLEQPRERLGGVGMVAWEVLNVGISYSCGIPSAWVDAEEAAWLAEDGIAAVPIDPKDPPVYEAQATYLRRHGLFLRGEERRLPPDAFEPEAVVP